MKKSNVATPYHSSTWHQHHQNSINTQTWILFTQTKLVSLLADTLQMRDIIILM